jgi:hypothetical protein
MDNKNNEYWNLYWESLDKEQGQDNGKYDQYPNTYGYGWND